MDATPVRSPIAFGHDTILVVEDDDGHALLTERSLRKQGFDVAREATGRGCLATIQAGGEHVVLLDLGLPDMTGQAVLAEIIARSEETPVIVVTGVDDLTVAVEALRGGAWDYVVKRPDLSHLNELPHVIRRNQDRRRLIHERNLYRSMISHDIKNPLHIILNYADMIEDEPHLRTETRMLLQRIKDNAANTLGLVNNFIEVSRIEAGKLVLERRPLCFSSLMQEVADRQAPLANAKGVGLRLERASDHSDVLVDRTSMERALTNLVSNAIKFTPAGGAVLLELDRVGAEILVSVSDTGRGIHEEDIPVIFEKYRRARETTLTEGSGLGLFIVKAIVEAHGGAMDVQSTVGRGSTFTMRLPVAAEAHAAPAHQLRAS
jgi:signal transduction histidine kinase